MNASARFTNCNALSFEIHFDEQFLVTETQDQMACNREGSMRDGLAH